MIEITRAYLAAGLCPLPAILAEKRPDLSGWKQYQKRLPTERELRQWFTDSQPICLLTGAVSGNLELLDFDCKGELFNPWKELVEAEAPGLLERLVIERSQSGGRHAVCRCEVAIPGSLKLAQRIVPAPNNQELVICGKRYRPRRAGDRYDVICTLIETRGEGGLFLCAPTPGYVLEQGRLESLPVLAEAERKILIEAAWTLNEAIPDTETTARSMGMSGRPGDEFNERGDVRVLLERHGWACARRAENECWRRPGKDRGWSATLRDRVFYVFSSNAAPFEANRAYAPFAVYALLEHQGDFAQAASALRAEGFGGDCDGGGVDLSRVICPGPTHPMPPSIIEHPDPGPVPADLFRVPGLISEVMDHCLATAPYPNVPLAFCGALALQAVLAGRKVRDPADNRSNLYILALAYSSVGKDWPRKINTFVLHQAGLVESLGEKFASGEGIQDSLFRTPSMLFQTDEIDGLLQSINKARDARHENILGTLLTMYSASNSIFPMRRKAGKESPGVIDQPCLVVYGTAIPTHYYGALSERMLTNGFFARMLIIESGPRSVGQARKQYGLHWDTLQKILQHEEPPGYQKKKPREKPVLGPYLALIHEILEADRRAPKKQRHTAKRILERLREKGYRGSRTVVQEEVRRWRQRSAEVFMPLVHHPGEAQADFGAATVVYRGQERKVAMFVMSLPFSDALFCQIFPRECTETFQEGHRRAFEFFAAVPKRISCDNSRIAVVKLIEKRGGVFTREFLRLESHYLFSHHFCLVRRPHLQGLVVPLPKLAMYDALRREEACHEEA